MEIYKSEFFEIDLSDSNYYIKTYKSGVTMNLIYQVLSKHPEIKVTSVLAIKNAIFNINSSQKFGEHLQRIEIILSNDRYTARVKLNISDDELADISKIYTEIMRELPRRSINYGLLNIEIMSNINNKEPFVVAQGKMVVNGKDSEIKMYKLKNSKPEIKDDGKVNFYELNLINYVNEGDWLGERTDPTLGENGLTVTSEVINPKPGKLIPLFYDGKTVGAEKKGNITFLYAKISGAVHYENGKISVSNFLEIKENVDFKTGNVKFDGYITVKGSIDDNFIVIASEDIEILGEFGVGSVKEINSTRGNIYIKGGIAGRSKAYIKSTKNIYSKFISDANIVCDETLHIGYYCINSNILAKELILESMSSQIIGGSINVSNKIVVGTIGSTSEVRTYIKIIGFDKEKYKSDLLQLEKEINSLKNYINNSSDVERIYEYKKELVKKEAKKVNFINCLKQKGEGDIIAYKTVNKNTIIVIKDKSLIVNEKLYNVIIYYENGEIKYSDIKYT